MYQDIGYSTYNDRIQVQVSLDGTNWTNVGTEISRYDGTTGWKEHTIDLSYIGQSIMIGILGISAYGNDCHIDDLSLVYLNPLVCQMNPCTGGGGCLADLGDPSENGKISSVDASLILQYVSGLITFSPSQECKADVNENSSFSAVDGSYTLQCAVGMCSSLPPNFQASCQAHGNCP